MFNNYQILKTLFFVFTLLSITTVFSQSCPELLNPIAGTNNAPVESIITWEEIEGVPGYIISLGTSPGGGEIIFERNVGSATSFMPPVGLPESTTIFVTITLFFFDSTPNQVCNSLSFTTEDFTEVPQCASLQNPINGEEDVNFRSNVRWNYAVGATSYNIALGTTPGGADIFPLQNIGNVLTLNPPNDFPLNTEIFVTLIPENENGLAINCEVLSFTTADVEVNLACTTLISPVNGETNVALTPVVEWNEVPGAIGYRVSIGTTPEENNILDNGVFSTTRILVLEFEPNRTLFITIIPFNEFGDALNCTQESFSTAIGCGPFLNRTTGELISLFPEFDFPNTFSICNESPPITISTDVIAEEYRWVRTTSRGTEIEVLSETQMVQINEGGFYSLEVSNFADPNGNNIPCTTVKEFIVEVLPGPTIESIDVIREDNGLTLTVNVSGDSEYEYAINNINGPYQASNVFFGVPLGDNIVYVRDINEQNCIVFQELENDSVREGFPNFFTPNGDLVNDFWQFMQPPNSDIIVIESIRIFDRFGKFLIQIDPTSLGWDGTFNGRPLPSGGYWFRAVDDMNQEIQGNFTLKR